MVVQVLLRPKQYDLMYKIEIVQQLCQRSDEINVDYTLVSEINYFSFPCFSIVLVQRYGVAAWV
jgi:hypothetical protein